MNMKILNTLILIVFVTANSVAQTIITDRPDQTESSSTIKKGSLQIESGFLFYQTEEKRFINDIERGDGIERKKNIYFPTTLFRLGLTEKLELRILNQYQFQIFGSNLAHGFNDLEVGLKMQLFQKENSFTEIAFLSHVLLPTAPSLFSEDTFGSINKLCVSHNLNSKIGLGYNLGYNYFNNRLSDFTYSFVIGFELTEKMNAFLEPYGKISELNDSESNVNMGITYLIKDNLQLDYSFGTGLNNKFNFMSIGCSINVF